ncbi:MAG: hypothetical protein BGO70_16430 [Bacteroidetes bacterium 43-93]|nr:helix-turn-helix transcriptional regulator [Bacteroidota bacterium]OJX01349.1 MAG: hypothetical protein BGO70_16430 [Bacteroidetes bacterium 43-93]
MTAPDLRIGSKLRILREVRGLKQQDIADRLGISQTAYSRYEQNQTNLSVEQAEKLAEIFDVSLPDLLSKDNPIITFSNNQLIEKGYIQSNYEASGNENKVVAANEREISTLKDVIAEQKEIIKNQQAQISQLMGMLGDYMKEVNKK